MSPSSTCMRRSVMFSPMRAMASLHDARPPVLPFRCAAFSTSIVVTGRSARPWSTSRTSAWKSAFLATKSVSELISTATPRPSDTATPIRPSAATRSAFLAALARPLVRSQSTAASMSPSVSVRAFLASIMPAPVDSRSSFTIWAVIAIRGSPRNQMDSGGDYPRRVTVMRRAQASASATASSSGASSSAPRSMPAAPIWADMPSSAARATRSQ